MGIWHVSSPVKDGPAIFQVYRNFNPKDSKGAPV